MMNKKKSWDYQRDKYKQINIKFNMSDIEDANIYHFAAHCSTNTSALIKKLLYDEMVRRAYDE